MGRLILRFGLVSDVNLFYVIVVLSCLFIMFV